MAQADAGYLIYELPMGGGWLVFPADGDCADYERGARRHTVLRVG